MPRFDFLCTDCESTFEHLLPPGAPHPACLTCGSPNVQKLLSPPPVIFKGSGFYATDARRTAQPSTGKTAKEGDGKSETTTKGEEKSEGKGGEGKKAA